MNVVESSFLAAATEARKVSLGIGSVGALCKAVKAFGNAMKSAADGVVFELRDVHNAELKRLAFTLKEIAKAEPSVRSAYNAVFGARAEGAKRLGLDEGRIPTGTTVLFDMFVRGITYFDYQSDPSKPVPLYHRFYSCGSGTEVYRGNNLVCLKRLTKQERARRRTLIERCYIERLIYDALYVHETLFFPRIGSQAGVQQDKGHMFRLDITRADFESCFKRYAIDVDVKFEDGFPVGLEIKRTKNGAVVSTESYSKTWSFVAGGNKAYDALVECVKVLGDGRVYKKVQTAASEAVWKL